MVDVLSFPSVPVSLLDGPGTIEPCPEVGEWTLAMFMTPGQFLYNDEHSHLEDASFGFLWSNVSNVKTGKRILGTAQVGEPSGGTPWAKIATQKQRESWFGDVPDYIVTLDAVWLSTARPEQICALVEHELYHCNIERDEFGDPKFDKYGGTKPAMKQHDVEEFVGVVKRYGLTMDSKREEMAEAVRRGPLYGSGDLGGICGTCARG